MPPKAWDMRKLRVVGCFAKTESEGASLTRSPILTTEMPRRSSRFCVPTEHARKLELLPRELLTAETAEVHVGEELGFAPVPGEEVVDVEEEPRGGPGYAGQVVA